jgi:RND family efflux transporter MFP subunit
MKNIVIASVTLVFFAVGCGNKNDINSLKKEREAISKEIAKLNDKLAILNDKIEKIEPIDNTTLTKVETVSFSNFEHYVEIQSNVKTDQELILYPEFAGVLKLNVTEGQQVSKGQVIATINDGGLSQQLAQAKAQASLAKSAFEKQQNLWTQHIGSEIQYLQAKTNHESAQKQVSAIQMQLGKTKMLAPFSGTIDQTMMQSGQVVAPGVPVMKIVSTGNLKIKADVPDVYIGKVKVGTKAQIEIPNIMDHFNGTISRVSSSVNPMNRSFVVELPLANPKGEIKPNLMAKIKINDYRNSNAIVVPTNVIKQDANNEYYVLVAQQMNNSKAIAKKVNIKRGESSEGMTEVLGGLNIGDKVIVEGATNLSEGSKIKF